MAPASVLVVDDDTIFRRIVKQFLWELGNDEVVVVDSAKGGFEGLIKVHSLQPDIVLIDLILPDLHGLEVIARLRRAVPRLGIIAMSPYHVDSYRQASLDAGANDFIFKSTLNAALLPAIRRVKEINWGKQIAV